MPENAFLDACVELRKERGKRLRSTDIKRAIQLVAPHHEGRLDLAIMQVHRMKLGAPRPELLEVVNFSDRYLRAKKENQLNNPEEQQRVLLEVLNRQMGKSRSARDESSSLFRSDIKRLIREMESGEFPASLKIEARKKISGFDAFPQDRKDKVLHGMQVRELAKMTPRIFDLYYRSAAREGHYQAAFQWVVRCLESPSNRQALANQLMAWYGSKKRKRKD